MRGKVCIVRIYNGLIRITPAYAGKRPSILFEFGNSGDHPRLCGEKPQKRIR